MDGYISEKTDFGKDGQALPGRFFVIIGMVSLLKSAVIKVDSII